MLLLPDVSNEHRSLTFRTLRSFQYLSDSSLDYRYVLKCDDDSFMNLFAVTDYLSQRSTNGRLYWGQFLGGGYVLQDGQYAEYQWSLCDRYLPYAFGGGYILSMDLVRLVSSNAPHLRMYRNEDVSLSVWLAPYNIDLVSDSRFNTAAVSRGCKKSFIVMHKVDIEHMYKYFGGLAKEGFICTKENYWFHMFGTRYNWRVRPSKCCQVRKKFP